MSRKSKGTRAERELIHLFWNSGWTAVRVAGSGSMQFPSPDIIAGNAARKLAIECKATKEITHYTSGEQVENLKKFCRLSGSEGWLGIRFDNMKWYFLSLEDLNETEGNNYSISIELAKRRGLSFEQLIGKF